MEIQTLKRLVHEAFHKTPSFKKEDGVFVLGVDECVFAQGFLCQAGWTNG
jgi:hypothetical protein